jgi:hypothetical protein
LNEAETQAELIDPALKASGWGVVEGSKVFFAGVALISIQLSFAFAGKMH